MILITGADGFIGSYLLRKLQELGHHCVGTCLSDVDISSRTDLHNFVSQFSDISLIVHCASAARSGTQYGPDCFQNNINMYLNILEIATMHQCTLISFGSGSDTSRDHWSDNMDELSYLEYPPSNTDLHAESKATISKIIQLSSYKNQLSLRLFGVFGEGENYLYKLVPNTIAKSLLGLPVVLVRDRLYNYIDVNDLARFIDIFYLARHNFSSLLSTGQLPNIINFCRDHTSSLSSIVSFVSSQISSSIMPITILKSEMGRSYSGSTKLLKKHFPDFEFSPINSSLNRQIDYYSSFIDQFDQKPFNGRQLSTIC